MGSDPLCSSVAPRRPPPMHPCVTCRWPFRVGYYGNPGDDGGVPEDFEFLPQMLRRRFG